MSSQHVIEAGPVRTFGTGEPRLDTTSVLQVSIQVVLVLVNSRTILALEALAATV